MTRIRNTTKWLKIIGSSGCTLHLSIWKSPPYRYLNRQTHPPLFLSLKPDDMLSSSSFAATSLPKRCKHFSIALFEARVISPFNSQINSFGDDAFFPHLIWRTHANERSTAAGCCWCLSFYDWWSCVSGITNKMGKMCLHFIRKLPLIPPVW